MSLFIDTLTIKKFNLKPSNFPNTENFYNQVVSIPIYFNLKKISVSHC